jgi:hypothetical protein
MPQASIPRQSRPSGYGSDKVLRWGTGHTPYANYEGCQHALVQDRQLAVNGSWHCLAVTLTLPSMSLSQGLVNENLRMLCIPLGSSISS